MTRLKIGNDLFYYYGPSIEFTELIQSDSLGRIWKYEEGLKTLWFDFTLTESDSYSYTSNPWNYIVKVKRGLTEETLLGVLQDCIYFIFDDSTAVDEELYYTFAPEIGLIQEANGMGITYLLESAVIDGQLISIVYDENSTIPQKYFLYQNYPDPFNSETKIQFDLSRTSNIRIDIFNISGHRIRTLVNEERQAGSYSVAWRGRTESGEIAPSGVYIYRMKAGDFEKSRKLLLLK